MEPSAISIIESRAVFAVKRRRGESEEGGVGRKKKMADGTAYMRITRGWHGHVAILRPTPCSRQPLSFFLSLSRLPVTSRLSVPSPTCHGQFLSRRICLSLPIVKALRGASEPAGSLREKTRTWARRRETRVARTDRRGKEYLPSSAKIEFRRGRRNSSARSTIATPIARATHSRPHRRVETCVA